MSRETVELVQSMYRPGDPSRFFNLIHEEVEAEFDAAAAPPTIPNASMASLL
jgi:hypothetical protein